MLSEQDKRAIRSAKTACDRSYRRYEENKTKLHELLYLTKQHTGCTLEELGQVLGVSRQRVHQILKGE